MLSRSLPEFLLLLLLLLSRTWQTPRKGPCSHHCSSWPLLAYWCAGTCKFLESSDLNTHTTYLPTTIWLGGGRRKKKEKKNSPQLIINVASSYVHAQTDDGSDDNSWLDYGSFCDCMTLHAHDQFHPHDNVTAKVCNDFNGTTNDWPADPKSISFLKHVGICTWPTLPTFLPSSCQCQQHTCTDPDISFCPVWFRLRRRRSSSYNLRRKLPDRRPRIFPPQRHGSAVLSQRRWCVPRWQYASSRGNSSPDKQDREASRRRLFRR